MAPTPDKRRSSRKDRPAPPAYDTATGTSWPIRLRCVELLRLEKGETVLDVGCGAGLSFEPLLERVGRKGRVIAFEPRPDMYATAAMRAQGLRAQGWQVDIQCASADDVRLPATPNAVLFHYVHDITRTPQAVANLFAQFPPGTRLAVAGMKFFPWWLAPLNVFAWMKTRTHNARAHELHKPWSLIEPRLQGFTWKPTQGGMGYIGSGRVRGG